MPPGPRPWSMVALLALLTIQMVTEVGAKASTSSSSSSSTSSALCSKFPSYCDQTEALDKGKTTHQRFAETKWRKRKGDTEITGHLAPKRVPKHLEEIELDDAAQMRAATIREAEKKLRVAEGGSVMSFDKKRTVDDARRKALLIQEARRKRRQRMEEMETEEEDEDEMDVEVEDEDEENEDDDDDDAVVEDEESDEDEDDEDDEDDEEEEEEEEEEYVEESLEEEEEEEEEDEEEEEEREPEISEEDEPEDEDEELARKKIREAVLRRRKWKEEEARMKQREEERKRVEEEQKKGEEEIRKRRIEEIRKKKREQLEARLRKEEEEEEEKRKAEEEEEERRVKEREETLRKAREEKEKEERRRLDEKEREEGERKRKEEEERERERQEQEKRRKREEEETRRIEEEKRKKREEEEEEARRIEEEKRKKREEEEEEARRIEEEKLSKQEQEEEKRRREEERKKLERREAEEKEKKRQEEEKKRRDDELRKKSEEEERERKRKLEELEKERKRKADEEERERRKKEEDEKMRKLAEEELRKKKQEEEKRKKMEEEEERRKKIELEEEKRKKIELEEDEEKRKKIELEEEKEKRRKIKLEEEEERTKRRGEEEAAKEQKEKKKRRDDGDEVKAKQVKQDSETKVKGKQLKEGDDEKKTDEQTPWMSGFPEFFAPTADDDVKNEECKKHSRIFVQHLAKYKTWALNMYDATAKLPSGVLSGNAIQLGDFDECLAVDVRLRQRSVPGVQAGRAGSDGEDAGLVGRALSWVSGLLGPALGALGAPQQDAGLIQIRGRYCLAGMDLELRRSDPNIRAALDRALAHSFLKGSLNDSAHFVPRFRTLSWGLCVPDSCSARDVELGLRAAVGRFQRSGAWGAGLVRARLALPPAACRDAPRVPPLQRLPPSCLAAAGAVALLLLLALLATIRDTGHEPDELGGLSGVVACFSLKRNWSALTAPEDPGADDIRCIHGVRCACSLLLYVAHKVVPLAAMPFSNRDLLAVLGSAPASLLLRASLMYTDTFLLVSGALAAFHLSRQLSRAGALDWASRLATRVIRLTPTLGLVTVLYAYVLEHLGSGPLWGQLVEENARICRQNLWRNLLYVQNFWPFEQMCAPHTHHLALDMQLSLLVPPLVWLLVKAWPLASPLLLALLGGSTWLRQRAALDHGVSLLIYNGARPADLYRAADLSYIQAPHRATAYLIGVALGYLLHRVPRKLHIPKPLVWAGWACCLVLGGWALFSQRHVARLDYRLDVQEAARFNALGPVAWAAAAAWLIFACHTGHGGRLDRVLCAWPLVLLSRISYSFYLIQFLVFFYNAGTVRSQREFGVSAAVDLWELLVVLALSTLVTLLVDLPMQSVRSAFSRSKRRQSLKWDPPTPTSPHEFPAAYYYSGTDVYTSRPKVE